MQRNTTKPRTLRSSSAEPRYCSTCTTTLPKLEPAKGQAKNSAKAPQHHQNSCQQKLKRGIATHAPQHHQTTYQQARARDHATAASTPQHHHTATLPVSSSAEPQYCSRCTKKMSTKPRISRSCSWRTGPRFWTGWQSKQESGTTPTMTAALSLPRSCYR